MDDYIKNFLGLKEKALEKLKISRIENDVDDIILPVLNRINALEDYYTTSSCAGRIVLLELPCIGDKRNAIFLGKWHRKIDTVEVLEASKKASKGFLWLLAQSPIIHIGARTPTAADKMLKLAVSAGFKHSGLKSFDKKIVVEVASTERLDAPVGKDGKLFCDNDYLNLLIEICNEIMDRSGLKLSRFEDKLKKLHIF